MVGAKFFGFTYSTGFAVASFKMGRGAKNAINHVSIELNGLDLYNVKFSSVRGLKVTEKAALTDVFAEDLVATFERETGFFLSF